ncbi:radical SAM protein [Desulfitobacterium hafniense]|uniref:radical SAM protein n=1 Tax=Desulfitobacterium hafniense TaxID=49338 RepID=UPI00037E8A84|nr:radical SAM protein [Desulfitobacterium hafniense]
MEKFTMPKLAFYVTLRCNLRCRLCAVYAPYYDNPFHPTFEFLMKCIDRYFEIVDHIKLFSVSGGEPLLREDLSRIINKVHTYANRIDRFEIITNGTIVPSDKLIESLRPFGQKLNLLVDNYGFNKSLHAQEVADKFRLIPEARVILRDYHSENMHCGGWVDYGISEHSIKKSESSAKRLFRKCSYPQKLDFCTSMVDGKLYSCTQLRRLIDLGVIAPDPLEVFDLFDLNINDEDFRKRIMALYDVEYLSACAYCNGICDDSLRYAAAEQILHSK